jgi:biotin transport system substrate-specific component
MTALGVVLLAICSWISIAGVTLQTFGVFFLLSYFGAKRGTLTVCIYLLMGALGIPVFSGFGGGIGWLLGPTGGFLLGFLAVGVLHILAEILLPKISSRLIVKIPLITISVLCCYLCGACTTFSYYLQNGSSISFYGVFIAFIFNYGILDAAKIILACYLAKYLKKVKPI